MIRNVRAMQPCHFVSWFPRHISHGYSTLIVSFVLIVPDNEQVYCYSTRPSLRFFCHLTTIITPIILIVTIKVVIINLNFKVWQRCHHWRYIYFKFLIMKRRIRKDIVYLLSLSIST
jgi:hypothetical protein